MFEQSIFSQFELRDEHFNKPYTGPSVFNIDANSHNSLTCRRLKTAAADREKESMRKREITGTVGGRL